MALDTRMTRHVKDRFAAYDALFAAGELVEQLTLHPGWSVLMDVIADEKQRIDTMLDGASAPLSQAEYAQAHGRLDGIGAARRAADAIVGIATAVREEQESKHNAGAEPLAEGS